MFGSTEASGEEGQQTDLFGKPESVESDRRLVGMKKTAMEDFERDQNRKLGIEGTLWAYNAAVYAIDFGKKNQRDRVDALCLAEGAPLKERALRVACERLEARP